MDNSIEVIKYYDKPKFFDALKVVEGPGQLAGKIFAAIGLTLIASVVTGLFFGPPGPIIVLVGFIVYSVVSSRGTQAKNTTTATPLGRLARAVADIVFVPMVGLAIYDKSLESKEEEHITKNMQAWGYSKEFIDEFIKEWSSKPIRDILVFIGTRKKYHDFLVSQKKVYRGEIKEKDLCVKSFNLCKTMDDEINGGMRSETHKSYLLDLKERLGV